MKYLLLSIFVIVGCSTTSTKKFDPVQNYKSFKLPNGLNVLYLKEDKLPYLSLSLAFFNGSSSDPKNSEGLTAATMNMLTKGTQKRSANQISEEVEILGADLDVSVDKEYANVSLEGLSWHEDKLLEMFSDIVLNPRFNDTELERYKKRTTAQIQQSLDQASYLASDVLERILYKGSSYEFREQGTIRSLNKIRVQSLKSHYSKMTDSDQMWLVVVGKSTPEFVGKVENVFSKLKKSESLPPVTFTPERIQNKSVIIIDKPEAAQAEIRIGHYGLQRDVPDYMPAMIANSILGQGFTSRLVDRVRDQLGLTYSISSSFEVRKRPGFFAIRTFTQNERVGQAVSEILKIYKDFYEKGVTSKELRSTQQSMIGKFPLLLETPEKLAYNLMILRFFGISDDYLKNYNQNVENVSLTSVNEAIRKYYDPNNLKIVILGKGDAIESQVRDLGRVEKLPLKSFLD